MSAVDDLEALAPKLADAIQAREFGRVLGKAMERLAEMPKQVKRFSALMDAAGAVGAMSDRACIEAIDDAIGAAEDIGELLVNAHDAESLKYVSEEFPAFSQHLRSVETAVRQSWYRTVRGDFVALIAIGKLLESIGATSDLGKRLSALGVEARSSADQPMSPENLSATADRLCKLRTALNDEMHQSTKEPDVDSFLTAVVGNDATLEHLTPPVMDWLAQNDALRVFSIRGKD